jgi:MFS family permease
MVSVFWVVTALTPVAALLHTGVGLGALFFAIALLPPTANTAIVTRQLLLTPDELRGRLTGVLGLGVGLAATIGPALGGLLMELVPGSVAVLICAAGVAVAAVLTTASPTLRAFPDPARETDAVPV